MRHTPEYRSWVGLRNRCMNPKNKQYPEYGGRGITVCERWQKFEHFYADMGPKPSPQHSVDRIDNDKGYDPANCRWATQTQQGNNKRSNVLLTFGGVTMTLTEWARHIGVKETTLRRRLDKGWPLERALTYERNAIDLKRMEGIRRAKQAA